MVHTFTDEDYMSVLEGVLFVGIVSSKSCTPFVFNDVDPIQT